MPSINVDLNYFSHIKTMRLVARLGPGSDVLPIKLWAHVGNYKPQNGCVEMLEEELEHVLGWWGQKGLCAKALIEIGFVTKDDNFWQVHDWLEHSGHLAHFKERAEKAAQKRWGVKRKRSNATSNAKSMSKQCPNNTSSTLLSITNDSNTPTNKKLSEWFNKIWLAYPKDRRHGKEVAFARFSKSVVDLETARCCARALENYLKNLNDPKYLMRASRWFGEWEDHADDKPRDSERVSMPDAERSPDNAGPGNREQAAAADNMLRAIADSKSFGNPVPPNDPATPRD